MPSLRSILPRKKQKEVIFRPRSLAAGAVVEPSKNTLSIEQKTSPNPQIDPQDTAQIPTLDRANNHTEKYGLISLHSSISTPGDVEDQDTNPLDIVAIHGITGDAHDTWTHDNGNLWLRDLIPKDLPGVRVFSYGYPAEVFCTLSTGTLDTFARSLLEGLKRERRKKEVRKIENLLTGFH
jgi:hypothetical protein